MTNEQAVEMMKAKLECMTREGSGTDRECNAKRCDDCDLCYAQGNMGEQKEWLRISIEALENQKTGHWITKEGKQQGYDIAGVKTWYIQIMCNECGFIKTVIEGHTGQYHYCPNCGAKMKGE